MHDSNPCAKCVWYNQCGNDDCCDWYENEDEQVYQMIEENRYSFREEWHEYIYDRE